MKEETPDLSIVIPTWNNKSVLGQCLESILDCRPGISLQFIVVDNGSEDQTAEFMRQEHPQALTLRNSKNLGFSRACNQGIGMAEGRYVLLLNNDTLVQPGTLERLVKFMDAHPDVGIAAPRLFYPDGSLQMSVCLEYTNLKYAFFGGQQLPFPLSRVMRPMVLPREEYDRDREVAWAAGACMIVRKEALANVGLLDENIFMYYEDMEWCYRFRQKGFKVFFVADTGVVHLRHHSSREHLQEVFRQTYLSKKYFVQKHRSNVTAALYSLLTLVGSLIKLPFHSARLLLRDKRDRADIRYRIASHWEVVKTILFHSPGRRVHPAE